MSLCVVVLLLLVTGNWLTGGWRLGSELEARCWRLVARNQRQAARLPSARAPWSQRKSIPLQHSTEVLLVPAVPKDHLGGGQNGGSKITIAMNPAMGGSTRLETM